MKEASFLLPTFVSPVSPMISLCILFFSFLVRKSLGVDDPQFLACSVPKTCGDGQNIKFPFYIKDRQEKYYCGQPGFEISCNNNGQPTFNISKNNYTIHQIFYQNQTLRVSNPDFTNSNTGCIPLTKNTSFPGIQFDLEPKQINLHLLYNCSNSSLLHSTDLQFYAGCDGENVLALSEKEPKLGDVSKECKTRVVAPVEAYGGEIDHRIIEVLRNGFWLNWKVTNCRTCEDSGGFCGSVMKDNSNYSFQCFCADRPHFVRCNRDIFVFLRSVSLSPALSLSSLSLSLSRLPLVCIVSVSPSQSDLSLCLRLSPSRLCLFLSHLPLVGGLEGRRSSVRGERIFVSIISSRNTA